MAIKINWKDLIKRYIGTAEVGRVYEHGVQVWGSDTPPVPPTPPTPTNDYLCFTPATEDGCEIVLRKFRGWNQRQAPGTFEISYDWNTWQHYNTWDSIFLDYWERVYFRNESETPMNISAWANGDAHHIFSIIWKTHASWDINYLLCKNSTDTVFSGCFERLFTDWRVRNTRWCELVTPPRLPATTLADSCYASMFFLTSSLTSLPELPATNIPIYAYSQMFDGCSVRLSEEQTREYPTPYRIPTTWTWTVVTWETWGNMSMSGMFNRTWWDFIWTPEVNKTYYCNNWFVPPVPPEPQTPIVSETTYNFMDKTREEIDSDWVIPTWNTYLDVNWLSSEHNSSYLYKEISIPDSCYCVKIAVDFYTTDDWWYSRYVPAIWVYYGWYNDYSGDSGTFLKRWYIECSHQWSWYPVQSNITYPWTYRLEYTADLRPFGGIEGWDSPWFDYGNPICWTLYRLDWGEATKISMNDWQIDGGVEIPVEYFATRNCVSLYISPDTYIQNVKVTTYSVQWYFMNITNVKNMGPKYGDDTVYRFTVHSNTDFLISCVVNGEGCDGMFPDIWEVKYTWNYNYQFDVYTYDDCIRSNTITIMSKRNPFLTDSTTIGG